MKSSAAGMVDIEKIYARNIVSELRGICFICGHSNIGILTPKCEHYKCEGGGE